MLAPSLPLSRDLVLIGGGHTHTLVLRRWAMNPLPGARVTLINPEPTAAYSGMLPGHVAGHYSRDALDIDLMRLASFAGARFVLGAAHGLDLGRQSVSVMGEPEIGYDVLSIDIGITSAMPDLPGFAEHVVPAKPLGPFALAWQAFVVGDSPKQVAIIGGGIAGVELAMAMAHRLGSRADAEVTVIDSAVALGGLSRASADRLRRALVQRGVQLLEHTRPVEITAAGVLLDSGTLVPARFVTGAATARPHDWLARTGLANTQGFLPVDAFLRTSDPQIFAAGDCADMRATPRPKAGVFAVRQAPVLLANLRAALVGQGGLRRYRPQKDYLKLISLGERSALADRFGIAFAGRSLWRLKDRIDRAFMERFDILPRPHPPALPWPRAAGARQVLGDSAMCGGCGSKIGPATLRRALPPGGFGDDAAILETGGTRQVISTDHLRAFIDDPVTMTRIAAVHALGDVWAMGAQPQAGLLSVVLPRQAPVLAERHLSEVMAAAHGVFAEAGAKIVGGHSTLGDGMLIGFTVTGFARRDPITLAGARPGDRLILTKPLGTGVLMAAHMQQRARGVNVAAALREMMRLQGAAAEKLGMASAMTDVTGFGLLGHLSEICGASGVGARIALDALPILDGALVLSEAGIRSTLFAENRAGFEDMPDTPLVRLLFDPQTGGGLLAAVGDDAERVCDDLKGAGFRAAVIGEITDRPGQTELV